MEWLSNPEIWIAFLTLTALEIVLGIDNIIFISILVSRLPPAQQARGRIIGLGFAMLTRIGLLLSITWVMSLGSDLFSIANMGISGRDLILFFGGLFLIFKSSTEVFYSLEGEESEKMPAGGSSFTAVILQIAVIDIIFSLDSVITAVGLVQHVPVMVAAIVISVFVMMAASASISSYIDQHPSLKMLALSFLIVIGVVLIGESVDAHIPKGYVYFAMAFSLGVEMLNIRARNKRAAPVQLNKRPPRA